jgi:hypothetical protein
MKGRLHEKKNAHHRNGVRNLTAAAATWKSEPIRGPDRHGFETRQMSFSHLRLRVPCRCALSSEVQRIRVK